MAKSISDHLALTAEAFLSTGAFNAILDVDSLLFIDPHLLSFSSAPEVAASYEVIETRFRSVLKLLLVSQSEGDPFWCAAIRLFTFPELKGVCIGYSAKGTSGSGIGANLQTQILRTAKTIANAGILDPELFELVALFEENMGPDRISDMVGGSIVENLLAYSERVLRELNVKTVSVQHGDHEHQLVRNPYNASTLILLPRDVLRDLPVAHDWSDIDIVCSHNDELRQRVNRLIGNLEAGYSSQEANTKASSVKRAASCKRPFRTLQTKARVTL